MARHCIILDCDPGVDDAIAILLALAAPEEIELLGITCVAGNLALAVTERNARRVCGLAGRRDIPVYAGSDRPLLAPSGRTSVVHGTDGLGDIGLPDPIFERAAPHAVDFIVGSIMAAPGAITLCAIGPMTNVALAIGREPRVAEHVRQILFMGGAAFGPGNITPAAEFNIFVDPEAARIVLSSGAKLTMFGLDATRQAVITPARLEEIAGRGGQVAEAVVRMLRAYSSGDPCLHDPCVVASLIDPTLFDGVAAHVTVDCGPTLTRGRTMAAVHEGRPGDRAPNCRAITTVGAERLFALLADRLAAP